MTEEMKRAVERMHCVAFIGLFMGWLVVMTFVGFAITSGNFWSLQLPAGIILIFWLIATLTYIADYGYIKRTYHDETEHDIG